MAKSLNRGLGALAALGALSYHLSKSGGGGKGTDTGRFDTAGAEGYMPSSADATDPAAMFRASERAERATPAMPPAAGVNPSVGGAAPASVPGAMAVAPDAAAMFRARERAERGTPAMRNPNISEEVAQRTGVKLDSRAGAGRGIQGGPTAEELEEYANLGNKSGNISAAVAKRTGVKLDSKAGAGRGSQGGPTARQLAEYQQEQERERMRGRGSNTTRKAGGAIKTKKMASGGMTSASKRADGIATKGKTKCKMY